MIDGGLCGSYLNNSDSGTCTAVGAPEACPVLYHADFSSTNAQADVVHGTHVSAIALDASATFSIAVQRRSTPWKML